MQNIAGSTNRFIDVPQTVSLINQERTNNQAVRLAGEASPTAYYDDKTLPSLPSSVLNVMQAGRGLTVRWSPRRRRRRSRWPLPFDYVVTGSYSLRIHVK